MKFTYAGSQFQLEFERKYSNVEIRRRTQSGAEGIIVQRSQFPYTSVRLLSLNPLGTKPTEVANARVGCAPTDKFSNEEGRRQALRKLTDTVEGKELRAIIWKTYLSRRGK